MSRMIKLFIYFRNKMTTTNEAKKSNQDYIAAHCGIDQKHWDTAHMDALKTCVKQNEKCTEIFAASALGMDTVNPSQFLACTKTLQACQAHVVPKELKKYAFESEK